METVSVALGARAYDILIAPDQLARIAGDLAMIGASKRRVVVITCPELARLYPDFLKTLELDGALLCVTSVDGEKAKSVSELENLWEKLAEARCDRGAVIVAFGGGVVGDLAGFLAASYMRGVDFIQIPTTLLSMVDSSVGGKTGINLRNGKNLVGAFLQPKGVYADTGVLRTLPPREFAAGMAEVIKYGLLSDAALFSRLEKAGRLSHDSAELPAIIRRCCEIKAAIVADDEFETKKEGGRALLNLGHTFGHAIENVAGYGEYLHGEAVAIGCVMAARLSQELGLVGPEVVAATESLCRVNALPARLARPLSVERLMEAMRKDKKVRAGTLRFVVLNRIGEAATRGDVPADLVEKLWREFGAA